MAHVIQMASKSAFIRVRMIIRLPRDLVTLRRAKGRLLFLFYFNDFPSAAVNISVPFDDPKFYRVINSIPQTLFPYKPIGKCNFIALKASGVTYKRYPNI